MTIAWDIDTIAGPNVYVDHAAAVREIRDTKRPREAMFRAALYTYRLCFVTRIMGAGPRQMAQKEFVAQLGYSLGYLTALKRVGKAIVFHRVPADSPVYSAI